jgi:hypothetical protein
MEDFKPVVLSVGDGVKPEELEDFIKAVRRFDEEAKERYKGENIRYFFLPDDLVAAIDEIQNKKQEE